MEEILIDCMDPDESVLFSSVPDSNGASRNNNISNRNEPTKYVKGGEQQRETEFIHTAPTKHNGKSGGEKFSNKSLTEMVASSGAGKRLRSDSSTHSAIMMYSPDIPSAMHGYDTRLNLANYYTLIETEESVKCVVSTILFVVILIAIFLVALFKNPQM